MPFTIATQKIAHKSLTPERSVSLIFIIFFILFYLWTRDHRRSQ